MSRSYRLIRVNAETYERLRRLRDGRGCSFNKLLRELLDGLEAADEGEKREAPSCEEAQIPVKCPKCGHDLDGSIAEPHVLLGSVGIEIIYDACPRCLWPLREKLSWRPAGEL